MADCSVDSIVTDPPYGLSFMGKRWDYDVPAVEVWVECLRVLKPGGHLLAFAGTRTQHRMAVRIEDAGFEIRDMIAWLYGSGFPKSHNGDWGGTALKPAMEPITVARKPLIGTVATNWSEYGTGALNIDGCRVGDEPITQHGRAASENRSMSGANYAEESGRAWTGRWPANICHDGSDEVVAGFPVTGASKSGGKAGAIGYHAGGAGADRGGHDDNGGSAARFFYCAKASKADRSAGTEHLEQRVGGMVSNTSGQHMTRRDEGYQAPAQGNFHPTVKPTDLMAYLVRLVTPKGGIVLDPFMGSGSTGKACMREGMRFVGCELDPEYLAIARARIEHEAALVDAANAPKPQADLFA